MEHRQAAKSPQSTQVQPSAINSRASPLPRATNHPRRPGRTPRPRAILYALRFRFAPIEHERPARKPSRHTCGKLRERLSFYYLSPNCVAPLKPMPKPMPFCTSQNRQLIFRQNALAETFRDNIASSPANASALRNRLQTACGNRFEPLRAIACAQLLALISMGITCIQSVILCSRAYRNQEVIWPCITLSERSRCLLL